MHSIFVLGPFVKINLWVGAPGGHSFQVPMFLNGKKVQSETWRDGRKMVCSRIGECKEIKIGWSAESCGVQSFRRLNSWPIPMSPCQICQCVTKSSAEHPWITKESNTFYDVHNPATGVLEAPSISRMSVPWGSWGWGFSGKVRRHRRHLCFCRFCINHSFPHSTVPDSADTRWSDCPDAAVYAKRVTRFHDLSPASPRLAGLVMVKWSNSFWSTYC